LVLAALVPEAAPADVPPVPESAADALLGPVRAAGVRAAFSRRWLEDRGEQWRASHDRHGELRAHLAALDPADDTPERRWERLSIECGLHGVPAVAGRIAAFVESHPDHHGARFVLGSHLLSIDDPAGVPLLEAVAEALPLVTFECFNHLAAFHDRRGDAEAIRELKRRADEHEALMAEAVAERAGATTGDSFDPHALTADELAAIREAAGEVAELREAWLARRHVRRLPRWKSYVMIVKLRFPFFRLVTENSRQRVLQRIADRIEVDGHLLVLAESSGTRPVARMIKALPDARVFSRKA
jgi:hypothetical protein